MPNNNRSMYINLKPKDQRNELDNLNTQRHQQVSDRLMVLLCENLILYNLSESKQILCKKSLQELINKKPLFR